MTNETNKTFYYIFKDDVEKEWLFDGIDDDDDAKSMMEDKVMGFKSYEKFELSTTDYVKVFYTYDDDYVDEPSEEDCDSYSTNTLEHLEIYMENNDDGGHIEFHNYEVYKGGEFMGAFPVE